MAQDAPFRRPLIGVLVIFGLFACLFVLFTSIFPPTEFDETGSGSEDLPSWEIPGSVSCYLPLSRTALLSQPAPWNSQPMIPANSEQRQPYYIGLTPRQLSFKTSPPSSHPELPNVLKTYGEYFLREMVKVIRSEAKTSSAIWFEMYPVIDDWGQFTWAIPRWKLPNSTTEANCWQWIDDSDFEFDTDHYPYNITAPFLPVNYIPGKSSEDMASVFDDFLQFEDLYQKRVFGDCIWTKNDDNDVKVDAAWLGDDLVEEYRHKVMAAAEQNNFPVCRVVPQPARFNGLPISFFVEVTSGGKVNNVRWPLDIKWVASPTPSSPSLYNAVTLTTTYGESSPFGNTTEMEESYMNDIRLLDGELSTELPGGETVTFVRKNSVQEDNQLEKLVVFLEQRYQQLGVTTERQTFRWHGIKQFNLIAKLPALDSSSKRCSSINSSIPFVVVDHIDTAFAEDIYEEEGKRVSSPGADDNLSGTSALLRIVEYLVRRGEEEGSRREVPWCRSVWLVHLTGEEYPADDLGARYLVSNLLRSSQDVAGFLVLDMIGHPLTPSDTVFQVSTGSSLDSLELGTTILQIANETITNRKLNGVLRLWSDPKAYLFNTDGMIFMETGWPTALINEHINLEEGFDRDSYHTSLDLSNQIDSGYAISITQVAINSIVKLVGPPLKTK